jgi:hypothetical protein
LPIGGFIEPKLEKKIEENGSMKPSLNQNPVVKPENGSLRPSLNQNPVVKPENGSLRPSLNQNLG